MAPIELVHPQRRAEQPRVTWPILSTLVSAAVGAGIAWGVMTASTAALEHRVTSVEADARERAREVAATFSSHTEAIGDLKTRTALLERAVLSLEELARRAAQ